MGRRDRHLLLALAVGVVAVTLLDKTTGACSAVLHFAPFLALVVPLLLGRYLGEATIERLRERRAEALALRAPLRLLPVALRPRRWTPLRWQLFGRPPPLTA